VKGQVPERPFLWWARMPTERAPLPAARVRAPWWRRLAASVLRRGAAPLQLPAAPDERPEPSWARDVPEPKPPGSTWG